MKQILSLTAFLLSFAATALAQHNAGHNGKILMIASNPSVSKQTGWPIGAWYAEVTHPYWAFTEAGYTVDIASPDGGEVKFDGFSTPKMRASTPPSTTFRWASKKTPPRWR